MEGHDIEPDKELTAEQLLLVNELSEDHLKKIDYALISNTCERWRKVARVIGATMFETPVPIKGIPDVFYSQRIKYLVESGELECQGNLTCMRFSEVRRNPNVKT